MIENDEKTNLITSYYGCLNIWDWPTQAHRVCVKQRINEKGPSRQRYSFILQKWDVFILYRVLKCKSNGPYFQCQLGCSTGVQFTFWERCLCILYIVPIQFICVIFFYFWIYWMGLNHKIYSCHVVNLVSTPNH